MKKLFLLLALIPVMQLAYGQGSVGQYPALDINKNNSWDPILQQNAAVIEGDTIGDLRFQGFVLGGYYHPAAKIRTYVSGPVGNNTVPGNLIFMTGTPWPVMRMTVAHEGNVGVNTFDPSELFTVSDETPVVRWEKNGLNAMDYELYGGPDGGLFFRGGADDHGPGLTDYMVLTAIGRLGLGTNTPDQLLTISDESPVFRLESDAADDYEIYNDSGNLLFRGGADDTGPGLTDHMVLTGEGSLGLGTTDPQRLLTVSNADRPAFLFERGSDYMELAVGDEGHLYFQGGTDASVDLDTLMVLKPEGKLAIGTIETPDDAGGIDISAYTLYAAGGVLTEEVRVRTGWADFVFAPEYPLRDLKEVEAHIQQHGRLPEMPSTAQVEAQGLELGHNAVDQQVKIEELFLYVIQLNKDLQALQLENAQLKAEVERLKERE